MQGVVNDAARVMKIDRRQDFAIDQATSIKM